MKSVAVLNLVGLALVATMATTCIMEPVHSREEMADHWLGYPFAFLRQDIRNYNPETFPQYFRLVSPRKSPTAIELEPFLASWGAIAGVALAGWWLSERGF